MIAAAGSQRPVKVRLRRVPCRLDAARGPMRVSQRRAHVVIAVELVHARVPETAKPLSDVEFPDADLLRSSRCKASRPRDLPQFPLPREFLKFVDVLRGAFIESGGTAEPAWGS